MTRPAFFTVTLPDGTLAEKRSTRALTHAVVAQAPGLDSWFVARWCASEVNARNAVNSIWPTYAKRVVPVM
jgi:hypothetical protein